MPGAIAATSNSTTCTACPAGSVAPAANGTVCLTCTGRNVSTSASGAACAECPAGWVPVDGNSACEECGPGTAELGTTACVSCGAGSYSNTTAATTCLTCTAGRYAVGPAATECAACGAGKFSGPAASTCGVCGPGTYSTATAANCTYCPPGSVAPGNATADACTLCDRGHIAPSAGGTACTACGPGTAANETGASACVTCEAGSWAPLPVANPLCNLTDYGYVQPERGTSMQVQCEAGTYSAFRGGTRCRLCTPGFTSLPPFAECSQCTNGTYAPVRNATSCTACPYNAVAAPGASSCKQCGPDIPGTVADVNATSCSLCAAGSRRVGRACVACPAGWYSVLTPNASIVPPFTGAENCSVCPAGTYPNASATTCIAALPSLFQYTNASGAGAPSYAPAGWVVDASATYAMQCPAGSYVDNSSTTVCTPCPNGFWNNASAVGTCWECGQGRYQPLGATGVAECKPCEAGTIKPRAGAGLCQSCTDGRVASVDRTVCLPCDSNVFTCVGRQAYVPAAGSWFAGNISSVEDLMAVATDVTGTTVASSAALHACLNTAACAVTSVVTFALADGSVTTSVPTALCNLTDATNTTQVAACASAGVTVQTFMVTTCAAGYTGLLCADCLPGYALDWDDATCLACSSAEASAGGTVVAALAVLVAAILFIRFPLRRDTAAIPALRITIVFVQLLALLGNYAGTLSTRYRAFSHATRYLGDPLWRLYAPLQCTYGIRYRETFYLTLVMPIVLMVLAVIVNWALNAAARLRSRLLHDTLHSSVVLIYIIYFPLLTTVLKAFILYSEPIEGRYYLKTDLRVAIDTPEYTQLRNTAIFAIVVYYVIVPAAVFAYLGWNRARLNDEASTTRAVLRFLYDGTSYPGSANWDRRMLDRLHATAAAAVKAQAATASSSAGAASTGSGAGVGGADGEGGERDGTAAVTTNDDPYSAASQIDYIAEMVAVVQAAREAELAGGSSSSSADGDAAHEDDEEEGEGEEAAGDDEQEVLEGGIGGDGDGAAGGGPPPTARRRRRRRWWCRPMRTARSLVRRYRRLRASLSSSGTWWYEAMVHVRRIGVASLYYFFLFNFEMQMYTILFMLIPLLWLHVLYAPYDAARGNNLETASFLGIICTAMLSLMYKQPSMASRQGGILAGMLALGAVLFTLMVAHVVAPIVAGTVRWARATVAAYKARRAAAQQARMKKAARRMRRGKRASLREGGAPDAVVGEVGDDGGGDDGGGSDVEDDGGDTGSGGDGGEGGSVVSADPPRVRDVVGSPLPPQNVAQQLAAAGVQLPTTLALKPEYLSFVDTAVMMYNKLLVPIPGPLLQDDPAAAAALDAIMARGGGGTALLNLLVLVTVPDLLLRVLSGREAERAGLGNALKQYRQYAALVAARRAAASAAGRGVRARRGSSSGGGRAPPARLTLEASPASIVSAPLPPPIARAASNRALPVLRSPRPSPVPAVAPAAASAVPPAPPPPPPPPAAHVPVAVAAPPPAPHGRPVAPAPAATAVVVGGGRRDGADADDDDDDGHVDV